MANWTCALCLRVMDFATFRAHLAKEHPEHFAEIRGDEIDHAHDWQRDTEMKERAE